MRLRLEMGRYVLAEDYVRAMQLRERLREAVDAALAPVDVLLLTTQPMTPPLLGAASVDIDGAKVPVRAAMLKLTQLFNVTGHPAIALPAGTNEDGWPLSLQLVARRHDTRRLLEIAAAVEGVFAGASSDPGADYS